MRILVYCPKNTTKRINNRWLYGIDTIEFLIEKLPEYEFVIADGFIPKNKLYENIDLIIRPTRHDGMPIMVLEAEYLDIPVIWTYKTGYYIEKSIKEIIREIKHIDSKRIRKNE